MDRAELARLLGAEFRVAGPAAQAVVVCERGPRAFMAAFAEAVATGPEVFLADPEWSEERSAEFRALLSGTTGRLPVASGRGWLMVPSGGSSGGLKLARHDEETIGAAVRGFCTHFWLTRVNAISVLPLHHVSGLMAWMRCALTGGEFLPWDWKRLEAGERPATDGGDWVISLVPTQLQRLLQNPTAVKWLRGFRLVFVGGGPVWPELAEAAADARLPVSLTYGMTESAAMVTALRPEEFLAGLRSCGAPLPHARVSVAADGVVRIAGESVFRGYFPERSEEREIVTEDLGRFDEHGHLHLLGRRDAVIISGGKKIHGMAVEARLRASGEFADVAVIGVPDEEWGEAVVACYLATSHPPDLSRAMAKLAPHERPKRFVPLADWPRNAAGKVNRAELAARLGGA